MPVDNDQRDGAMQSESFRGAVNYEPNTLAGGTPNEAPAGPTSRDRIERNVTRRKISLKNDFAQAGDLYRSLSTTDQDHLIDNVVDSLEKADKPMQERMVDNFTKADGELGARVAQGLNL